MDDFKILSTDDLLLWCQLLSTLDKTSWAQLSACGGDWRAIGLRLDLTMPTPELQVYMDGHARHISEPLPIVPGEASRLRPALTRLLARPAMQYWAGKNKVKRLTLPCADDDTWLGWLLANGFTPVVRMGADDYGDTAWLEWRRQNGLTLHQAGADEPATGMWFVTGGDDEECYMTPEDAVQAAACVEEDDK